MKLKTNCRTGWSRQVGLLAALAMMLGIGVSAAQADVISGNFTPGAPLQQGSDVNNGGWKAVGWTMPAEGYLLDDITMTFTIANGGAAEVSIWSGAAAPVTLLTVLDSPPQINGTGDYTFTPASSLTMLAGETYWARATEIAGGNVQWMRENPQLLPTGLATHAGYIFNGNSSGARNRFEANGTLVPEPGTLSLLALGGLALLRRRR